MRRINIENKTECTGCGACVAVCTRGCLSIEKDELGFIIPCFSKPDACVDCGLCQKVCPQKDVRENQQPKAKAIYGQSKNHEELMESSSGGLFSILANYVLQNCGCVWGVEMTSEGIAQFACIEKPEELHRLRGSKYSEVVRPLDYRLIKKQLIENRLVMVSGTPCQIRALRKFLGSKEYSNIILVDLLCYGIQSPVMWQKYLAEVNPKHKPITSIRMRNKECSWFNYSMRIEYIDGTCYKKSRYYDPWLRTYSTSVFNRDSCTACQSKKFPHVSDFTIGDFWGYDYYPNPIKLDKRKGISLAFFHSEKAEKIFSQVSDKLECDYLPEEYILKVYNSFIVSSKPHPQKAEFLEGVDRSGFAKTVNTYMHSGIRLWYTKRKNYIKFRTIERLRQFIKRTIFRR